MSRDRSRLVGQIRFHPKGAIVLAVFVAALAIARDVRFGLAAAIVAEVIDWLFLLAPLSGSGRPRHYDV